MRVANKTIFDNINSNLSRITDALAKANAVVSSSKKINQLSDDPVGLVNVLDLRSSLANIEQTERNITTGKSWLTMGESALNQVEDLLTEGKALCVQMASATQNATERASAGTLVDGYLRQIVALANTEVGGRYIFAGTETDTIPFAFDDEDNPTAVVYSGNDTPFSVKIGKDLTVGVGRDGEEVFGAAGNSMFETLINLKSYLETNDISGIQETLTKLDDHLETIRTAVSSTGARVVRLETKEKIIQDLNLTYTDRKSQLEDADIAEAIMDLKGKQLAYQAALSSSSKVMSLSLVDYL